MAEKFEEKTPEGFEQKESGLYVPKEERGHIRSEEEIEEAREIIPEEKKIGSEEREKKEAEEWHETFYKLGGTRRGRLLEQEYQKEKKTVETAEIPKKGIEPEQILKEVGIEKPAESFEEVQKRLEEKLEKTRVRGGEKLSLADKNETTRDFYLGELGYSVKYKGLLHGKAELLGDKGKVVTDEKDKPMEFKTFFKMGREETPMIDFLKEKLKEKLEGKPEKEKTEEEKQEAGLLKAVKETKTEQEKREEKISSLAGVRKVGKERLSKLVEGLSYVAALDKLGVLGLREGKKLAIEGGKDLAVLGLSPAAAVEEAERYISGRIQVGEALRKRFLSKEKISALENLPAEKRPDYYGDLLETLKGESQRGSEEVIKGYDKIYKKGKILRLIEMLGGKLGRPIGRTLGPLPPRKEKYE